MVSFDKPAFCSYGKEQGRNAPVGQYASFAYTAALNHLLADRDHVQKIGDTTIVCWAAGAKPQYPALSLAAIFGITSLVSPPTPPVCLSVFSIGTPSAN